MLFLPKPSSSPAPQFSADVQAHLLSWACSTHWSWVCSTHWMAEQNHCLPRAIRQPGMTVTVSAAPGSLCSESRSALNPGISCLLRREGAAQEPPLPAGEQVQLWLWGHQERGRALRPSQLAQPILPHLGRDGAKVPQTGCRLESADVSSYPTSIHSLPGSC